MGAVLSESLTLNSATLPAGRAAHYGLFLVGGPFPTVLLGRIKAEGPRNGSRVTRKMGTVVLVTVNI